MDYSSRQENSGAFEEVDIPEEEKLKENQESEGKALKWSYISKEGAEKGIGIIYQTPQKTAIQPTGAVPNSHIKE